MEKQITYLFLESHYMSLMTYVRLKQAELSKHPGHFKIIEEIKAAKRDLKLITARMDEVGTDAMRNELKLDLETLTVNDNGL